MKILLVSDTHYFNENLERILEKYKKQVNCCIHCGDSSLDADHPLMTQFDYVVQGNHDDYPYPIYQNHPYFIVTHGHKYDVYNGYEKLIELSKKYNVRFCFHGHTHVPTLQHIDNITFINPGSLMMNRGSYGYGTYVILDINEHDYHIQFYHHETDEPADEFILDEGLELLNEFKMLNKLAK